MFRKKIKPANGRERAATAAVVIALAAAVIAAASYIMNKDSLTVREDLFVSMMGDQVTFKGKSRLTYDKDSGSVIISGGRDLILQGVPVYYEKEPALLLSRQMIYTDYTAGIIRRVNYFTEVRKDQEISISTDGKKQKKVDGGYLYDGRDVYLFLEPVKVTWGDRQLELEPLSFLAVFNKQGFYYYSYGDQGAEYVESGKEIVRAASDSGEYVLNMSNDIVDLTSGKSLLLAPDPESFEILK